MAGQRRDPGRLAYDSKQKLVAAMCALLTERGLLQRSGIGHESLYHHYRGKEDLALDAISHMRDHAVAFLEGQHQPGDAEADAVHAGTAAALDRLFVRRGVRR